MTTSPYTKMNVVNFNYIYVYIIFHYHLHKYIVLNNYKR